MSKPIIHLLQVVVLVLLLLLFVVVMSGSESPFIKLISAEGHEFYVDRKCAMVSGTIKAMLSGNTTSNTSRSVDTLADQQTH